MNGNIRFLILCVSFSHLLCVKCDVVQIIVPEIEEYDSDSDVRFFNKPNQNNDGRERQVASTVFQTVNKYNCSLDSIIEGSHLLVYGTKGWTFPKQDVNLTLRYPPDDQDVSDSFEFISQATLSEDDDYLITGFRVILYIDGPRSQGYINDGGVLQENITLSFVSSQLTSLSYEFWIFGVRKDSPGVVELLNSHYRLC